ncbi:MULTISPECIES: hypothetical protein [unclassified Lentimonas]|uniref:hypothetical protein n=1 Tax=unclassified Lentimonas TaxID=2630993 RepID=UPI0013292E71|nr:MULTISPECIES: hypothetical protein [unclassified Lentimonas]CAA6680112.1 Unannotated [Lentimonas sp. CC4]CAA6685092.1 Unannotated [Lentimonas sp. CC6]CAA6697447.1 Unannotated [Lentimonas sp. CC19]CAA6697739.1 Unannotated [Lentimonas sp. CC10]CAA7072495.1 Unannotated [Lentimonas sp. CC11]
MNARYLLLALQLILLCPVSGEQNTFNIKEYVTCSLPEAWEADGAYGNEIQGIGTMHTVVLKHAETYDNLIVCYLEPVSLDVRKRGPQILMNSFLGASESKAAELGETAGERKEEIKDGVLYYSLSIEDPKGKDSYLRGISFEWADGAVVFHYLGYRDIKPVFFDEIMRQFKLKGQNQSR